MLYLQEGEVEAVAIVHSYEEGVPPGSHKTRLTALNVCESKHTFHGVLMTMEHCFN